MEKVFRKRELHVIVVQAYDGNINKVSTTGVSLIINVDTIERLHTIHVGYQV